MVKFDLNSLIKKYSIFGIVSLMIIIIVVVSIVIKNNGINNKNNRILVDDNPPLVGNLKVTDVTESSVTLIVEDATDNGEGLHSEAYAFKCGDTYSSWQEINYIVCDGLNMETNYTFSVKVRDKVGNETEYTSIEAKTLTPVTTVIADGTIVYFNPVNGLKCDDYVEENSNSGNKIGCMKWYAFNPVLDGMSNEDKTKINLILDHNTTVSSRWSPSAQSYRGQSYISEQTEPTIANSTLKSDTSNWSENIKSTVRLISANEVAIITKHPTIDFSKSYETYGNSSYYFETNDSCGDCSSMGIEYNKCVCKNMGKGNAKYGWLFDRLTNCDDYGCFNSNSGNNIRDDYSYWTSTSVIGIKNKAWLIKSGGEISFYNKDYNAGIRPVITISKSKIIQ